MTQDKDTSQTQLWGRMFDAVKTYSSGSTREVSEITEAVTAAARSGCSCDGDPIECGHEAAAGHYEEKAHQLGDLVSQIYRLTLFGPDGETVRRDITAVLIAAQNSGVIDANGKPVTTR